MDVKPPSSPPPIIVLSQIVLGATAVVALFSIIVSLGLWWERVANPSILWLIGAALLYVVAPVMAIGDILRRKPSGRYLSYLTFLCTMAISLRGFLEITARPVRADVGKAMIAMFFLGMIFVSAGLLLGLIVSRKADEFFVADDEDPRPDSEPMPASFLPPVPANCEVDLFKAPTTNCVPTDS